MTLSEYLKLLKPIQTERAVGDFMCEFLGRSIRKPSKAEQRLEASGEKIYNPIKRHYTSLDSLKKIANGSSKLSKACAAELCELFSVDECEGFIVERRDDMDFIKRGLLAAGFEVTLSDGEENVPTVVARLLYKILTDISRGVYNTKPPLEPLDTKTLQEDAFKNAFVKNEVLQIGSHKIRLPFSIQDVEKDKRKDLPYLVSLLEVYSEKTGIQYKDPDELKGVPALWRHFKDQQKAYYSAEAMSRSVRDLFADGEENLKALKDEVFSAIKIAYYSFNINDGLTRLEEVLKLAVTTQFNSTILLNIRGLIDVEAKKGICHILINDKYITSWVEVSYDEPI